MTNKIKKLCLIIGLLVCLIAALIAKRELSRKDADITNNMNQPVSITQTVINTGSQWIIQTTYKLLKPIQ